MQQVKKLFIVAVICFAVVSCECYNKCSGHGTCDSSNRCVCHKQLGLGLNEADFNHTMYTGADCSERLCPTGVAYTPAVDEEEYFEVGDIKSRRRQLNEDRELGATDNDEEEGTGASEKPTTKPTSAPNPTPSIEEIIKDLNVTEIKKPIEIFKPVTSNTPSLGGQMKCGETYITITSQVGSTLVTDKDYTDSLSDCKVTYVRKDLSMSGVIDFNKGQTAEWDNGEEMRLYGFQYNTTYDVNVACIHDETLTIKEESGKVTLFNDEGTVKFTYKKAKKETYPMFCYLLTVGVDSDSKVQNVELLSSELASMIGKSSEGLVFGQSIDNGAVVVMKGEDAKIKESRERMLEANPATPPYPYVLNLNNNKPYNPVGPTTTPKPTTTEEPTTTASEKPVPRELADRILAATSAVAGIDFAGYRKYLQVGNKVFIRILTNERRFLAPQTMSLSQETQSCAAYCTDKNNYCGKNSEEDKKELLKDGCFVIFLSEKIRGSGNEGAIEGDDTIYFTLSAVGIHPTSECSGVGKCNRQTGQCECLPGYTGDACQILSCPNSCSNHGRCVKSSQTIFEGSTTFAQSVPALFGYSKDSKNKQKLYGCICDKGYRGPDCSLIECPSTKDPSGGSNDKEKPGDQYRDCSGRGICDYTTGNCNCFDGFFGTACEAALGSI